MKQHCITRRDFLREAAAGAAGAAGAALLGSGAFAAEGSAARSVVAVARSADALTADLKVNTQAARQILLQAVAKACGKGSAKEAFAALFKPSDIVGIVTSKHMNPTHPEIAGIVKQQLIATGVPETRIRFPQSSIDAASECTALIALPALKAHWLTGIGTVLKLYILYSGKPSNYHDEKSAKLGEIWNLDFIKGKTRLVIVDALRPLCDKGPQPDPRYLWNYGGIIASTDPVAAEYVGLRIIQARRDEMKGEPWPLSPPPLCIAAADRTYGLGTSDPAKIRVVKLGADKGALI